MSPPGPLRIVQIVEKLEVGGLERFAVDLAIALKQAGHFTAIYCVFQPGALAAQAQQAGVVIRALHKKPGFSWDSIRRLSAFLREDRIQVVHTHNSVIHHYGLLAAWRAGISVVVNTRHGTGVLHTSRRQEQYFRVTLPFTKAVICVCEDGRRFFTTHRGVPASKCHVILNGIPLEKFHSLQARPVSDTPPAHFRIGTVGRMVAAKAHTHLLEAFSILHRQLPQAELFFVGDGPLEPELRAQADRLGVKAAVHFLGARHDIGELLSSFDVFAFSSISEGLPIVILEAMAAGLPIISTRIGGVPEVAPEGDVAWYSEPGDPATLAANLYSAALSGRLPEMGTLARKIAFESYSIQHIAARYEDLFRRFLPGAA